ncbi:hypothetical protein ACFP1Z_33220 [Streptomyces gamaensis]|uniref:Uncharacterized protein n=1 Tax=Streptomyces gamaensis TaxID=1763542 RepID=A0ABW0ZBZ0_9ACTN
MSKKSSDALTPVSQATRGTRRRRLALVVIPITLLVAGAAAFLATGGYTQWQDQRSLDNACRGLLPQSALKTLMGTDRLHEANDKSVKSRTSIGWLDSCSIEARSGGSTDFSIAWGENAGLALSILNRHDSGPDPGIAVPIGHGWSGTMKWDRESAESSVILACPTTGKSLLVSVNSLKTHGAFDTPTRFGALAQVAIETATAAANKLRCSAQLGSPVRAIDLPLEVRRHPIPLSQAQGSCRMLRSLEPALMDQGVRGVVETPINNSLVEDCSLTNTEGEPLYHLTAYYGPYARDVPNTRAWAETEPAGINEKAGIAWATAECARFFGPARFTSGILYRSTGERSAPANPELQRQLVRAFSGDAVERHGCSETSQP